MPFIPQNLLIAIIGTNKATIAFDNAVDAYVAERAKANAMDATSYAWRARHEAVMVARMNCLAAGDIVRVTRNEENQQRAELEKS